MRRALLAAATAALLLSAPRARCEDAPPAEPGAEAPSASGWEKPQFRLDAELRLFHTDNLYHAQDRRMPEFETETDPYERYHDMKGPEDDGARLTLDLAWRFKHASKRSIGLRLRARQFAYRRNEIANHDELGLDATFGVSKKDRLRLGVEYSPEHFRKNLEHEAFPGITVFERADASDSDTSLEYEREWTDRWSTAFALGTGRRDYASPFDGRDEERDRWEVSVGCRATKRLDLELAFESESTSTPTSVESGVPKDRSHDDDQLELTLDLNLRHGWKVEQTITRLVRDYTTTEVVDASRYGRTDRRWELGLDVEKSLSKHWTVGLDVAWTENDAGRLGVEGDDEEYNFSELEAGIRVAFRK